MTGIGELQAKLGEPPPAADRGLAGRALGWSLLNTVVGRLGTLAIGIALARLLGPDEFGTYAVAFVALMAMLSFNELGVSLAIVRWQHDPAEIAPTVNAISVAMSAVVTVVAVLGAPTFASAMGDESATRCVQLLSLCVLVNGVVATPAALLQRAFRQDRRMAVDQVNTWLGALVSVGLAVLGAGAVSLVVGRLVGAGVSGVMLLRYSPLPFRFAVDRRFVRPLLVFGLPLAGSSVVVFLVGFLDQLAVGHLLGATLLGYYVLAFNLSSWPVSVFSQPLRSVAPALFARLQDEPAVLRGAFVRVLRPLAVVALPVCGVLAVTAPELVRLVYGPAWSPAADVLQALALLAALRIVFELVYDFLVVLGRSRHILVVQLAGVAALVPTLWFATGHWGIRGAAGSLVVVALLVTLPAYLVELARCQVPALAVARALLPGLAAGGLAALTGTVATRQGGPALLGLAVSGVAVTALVAAGLWVCRADLALWRSR